MKRTLALVLALGGCSSAVPPAVDDDDQGLDGTVTLATSDDVASELSASPVHEQGTEFVRLAVLFDATATGAVEVSTSVDGVAWSDWSAGVVDAEASDAADDAWLANVDVAGTPARYWRARAAAGTAAPRFVAITARDAADLAAEATVDDAPPTDVAASGDVAGATEALVNFHIYSFDAGKVGRAWLWLLRACRARGWHGHLSGPRTGLRTYAQQLSLWNAYQHGTGAPAFPPWGPSRHLIRNVRNVGTWYQAVDTDDVPNLIRVARGLGVSLHTPYLPQEPWHVEAIHAFGPPRGWNP